ncbi:MAG: T9SS type A sorting domain-containing protein [Bacteroidia bacterium]
MKKPLLSLALALAVLGLSSQDLSNGLLLHYDFNGNTNDVSSNNMHGTVYGATLADDKDGNPNSAYYFDGVDDYIEFPNDNSLKVDLPITFSVRFKINDIDATPQHSPVNSEFGVNEYSGAWIVITDQGHITIGYGNGYDGVTNETTRESIATGAGVIQEGTWHDLVAIIRSKDDMEIWLDCMQLSATDNGSSSGTEPVYNTTIPISGGVGYFDDAGSSPYYSSMIVDDIRYWNRDLTQEEVELLCPTLSVKENKEETLLKSVYPNPSNGEVTLMLNPTKPINIDFYDITGKIILNYSDYTGSELTIRNLKQGVYFVKVYDDTYQTTQRIIVTNH